MKVEVYFGATTRNNEGPGSFVRFMAVTNKRSIIFHEDYDDDSLINDIALVELPQDAPLENSYVGLVSLPSGIDRTRNLASVQGTVSGFGNDLQKGRNNETLNYLIFIAGRTSDTINSSTNLYYIQAPIMENSVCAKTFTKVNNDHVCLSSVNSRSACSGYEF